MNINKTKHIILKSNVAGVVPTIPIVSNHTQPGWIPTTDIYEGELFLNTTDQALYTRAGSTIIQINGSTVSRYLDDMIDVDAATPSSADILTYDGTNWISKQTFDGVLNVDETLRSVYQETCGLGPLAANSFAEGFHTFVGGSYGHTEGSGTSASHYAHAEGQNTTASGDISHSEGNKTIASGIGAHSEGLSTLASGAYSHTQGREAVASRNYQYSQGGGKIATAGDAQFCRMVYKIQTTDDSVTTIATFNTETNHIYGCRVLAIGVGSGGAGTGMVSVYGGYNNDNPNSFGYIKNLSGVASTSFSKIYEAPHGSGSDARFPGAENIRVNVSNTDILFQVTGAASNTINWVLTLEWTETII